MRRGCWVGTPGCAPASKALLDVDERNLVVSISPNIPVKQIIADIARPAGMIYYNDKNESVHWPDGRRAFDRLHPLLSRVSVSPRAAQITALVFSILTTVAFATGGARLTTRLSHWLTGIGFANIGFANIAFANIAFANIAFDGEDGPDAGGRGDNTGCIVVAAAAARQRLLEPLPLAPTRSGSGRGTGSGSGSASILGSRSRPGPLHEVCYQNGSFERCPHYRARLDPERDEDEKQAYRDNSKKAQMALRPSHDGDTHSGQES
ncbi:hypothetical protein SLS62_008525 [Diatrype stigma]|uniref:Uncharacterized protein n=1 Tax=Diatrype stigma TaxID=117547 RepID=A0AAN9UI40_9PEZI